MMKNLKQRYADVINHLTLIYGNNTVINDEYSDNPVPELEDYINSILVIETTEKPNYDLAVRTFIKQLRCFKWRFVNHQNAGDVWNPLSETFEAFINRTNHQYDHWYDERPYPTEDIIENWVKYHAKSDQTTAEQTANRPHCSSRTS